MSLRIDLPQVKEHKETGWGEKRRKTQVDGQKAKIGERSVKELKTERTGNDSEVSWERAKKKKWVHSEKTRG